MYCFFQVITAVEEKRRWVDEKKKQQERRPKTEPPAVFVHEIFAEKEVISLFSMGFINSDFILVAKISKINRSFNLRNLKILCCLY